MWPGKAGFGASVWLMLGLALSARAVGYEKEQRGAVGAPCVASMGEKIAIVCEFDRQNDAKVQRGQTLAGEVPRIAVDRAMFSFAAKHDNWMEVELAFTQLNEVALRPGRTVYLEVEDASGKNVIRRPLPGVDLASLAVGVVSRFHERVLIPGLAPGQYGIRLWIPSSDPALRFHSEADFHLSNRQVPDARFGVNFLTSFTLPR